tara:strand:+ start:14586 stop:15695 length:1110 start_codon:yes stop_codon:yes gene_type:complete
MFKLALKSVCCSLLFISIGQAQQTGWYAGIEGGYSLLGTEKSVGNPLDLNIGFKNGAVFGGIVGYDYGNYRVEAEVGKHLHNVDHIFVINDGGLGLGGNGLQNTVDGKSNHTRYMLNLVYDIQYLSPDKSIEPFIGTGVGFSNIKWSNISAFNSTVTNDAENVFSYQLSAGVRYNISKSFEMALKYRYFRSIDVDLVDSQNNAFDISYDTHDFLVSFVYHFGQQPSRPRSSFQREPAPAAKEVEARNPIPTTQTEPEVISTGPHKIYYDWDSSEIDEVGQRVIEEAAAEANKGKSVVIELTGHADLSGPEKYNETLSLKRAEGAKTALILEGIEGSKIFVEARGERDPEIPTADGVRERKNRRVVIVIK